MKRLALSEFSPSARRGLWLSVPMMLAGCDALMVGPDYELPHVTTPTSYRYSSTKNGQSAARREGWWKVFGDSGLDGLIGQVRSANHDLKAGVQRIEQARAVARAAGARALPQVAGNAEASRGRTSDEVFGSGTSNNFVLGLSAGWEPDLFGGIRRGQQAAVADLQAAEETVEGLRLALEAEAAAGYFTLRAIDREIQLVEDGVESRRRSLDLAKQRLDVGAVSSLDVSQAEALLASSEADLAGLRRERTAQLAALAVLAGRPASTFILPFAPLDGEPPTVPSGLPAELLRARPDIRAVERGLAAENERVGVAVAAFYPSIRLNGSLGMQAADISRLFDHGARFWGIGPQVYLPVFQGGANRAELARSQARYEEVLQDYQQAILEAIAEVETRLAATRLYGDQAASQRRAVKAAREARDTALTQYEGGTASYLNVLDAERTALEAERLDAVLAGARFVNSVNLIRALGGRW